MKFLISLLFLSICNISFAGRAGESIWQDSQIYCFKYWVNDQVYPSTIEQVSVSCVSKASIAKDNLEIEVLKLQKEKLEKELNKKK